MKRYAMVLAGMMIAGASFAQAQNAAVGAEDEKYFADPARYSQIKMEKAQKGYKCCLQCKADGVVETAIAQVAWMRLAVKDRDMTDLKAELDRLAVMGRTPAIRYKAYLACQVFDYPEIFGSVQQAGVENADELFSALANRLQKTLVGYTDRKYVRPE
jgi:hypothetical protein